MSKHLISKKLICKKIYKLMLGECKKLQNTMMMITRKNEKFSKMKISIYYLTQLNFFFLNKGINKIIIYIHNMYIPYQYKQSCIALY